MTKAVKIGLTGLPNSGKSSLVKNVIANLREQGRTVGGMVTESIMENMRKVGLEVVDITTGERATFAHINFGETHKNINFGLNPEAMETVGVAAVRAAVEDCDMVVIDEIGPIHLECPAFNEVVLETIKKNVSLLLSIHKKSRHTVVQDIRRRDDMRILDVTPVNRSLLSYKIQQILDQEGF
jgi:nucleoside-triphosphatase